MKMINHPTRLTLAKAHTYLPRRRNLLIGALAYGLMLANSLSLHSPYVGLAAFVLFVAALGDWMGKKWGGCTRAINFLIGCLTLVSLVIILMGIIVFLMIFSALSMWILLALVLLSCYCFEAHSNVEQTKQQEETKSAGHLSNRKALSSAKIAVLVATVVSGFLVAAMGRSGEGIAHVGQVVSPIFWLILFSSFVVEYLIWKDRQLSIELKLFSVVLVTLLIFGLPAVIYRNFITEDSFAILGVIRSVIETGIYGWAPNTFKTGYFALISCIAVASSAEYLVDWIYKIVTPLLVSVYVPLFLYLTLSRINGKGQPFVVLISLMFFPVSVFLSIPLEKSVATIFFLEVLAFSSFLLAEKKPRKADLAILSLALLATSFLHEYFALYSAIPLILSFFLLIYSKRKWKYSKFSLLMVLCLTSLSIPSSFVVASHITVRESTAFSISTIESIVGFWIPAFKVAESHSIETLPILYSANFVWVRYVIFTIGILTLAKRSVTLDNRRQKIWMLMIVATFWLGYFMLKVATQNPPEGAKDYRFGFFVDLSLVPLAGVVFGEMIERTNRLKIRTKLWSTSMTRRLNPCFRGASLVALCLILIATLSVYSGYFFDSIMERPLEVEDYGRYVVTDEKLESIDYIRNMSGMQKSVILSDNHMAKIALGSLGVRPEKAELFYLNSGGELYPYFNEMRLYPNLGIMKTLINKTNSEIGFFVIGLEDWKGWYSEGADWIDDNNLENLKLIADDWKVFGKKSDLYVFVFKYQ